jgi:hypothetical protein
MDSRGPWALDVMPVTSAGWGKRGLDHVTRSGVMVIITWKRSQIFGRLRLRRASGVGEVGKSNSCKGVLACLHACAAEFRCWQQQLPGC